MIRFREFVVLTESVDDVVKMIPSFLAGQTSLLALSQFIYNSLTDNQGAVKAWDALGPQKMAYHQHYKQIIAALDNHLKARNWISDANGGWIEWYRGGVKSGSKLGGRTQKMYITIDPSQIWDVMQKLPGLMRHLDGVKLDPNMSVLGVKVPVAAQGAFTHNDSIVIHFYDPNAATQIQQAIAAFKQEAGVKNVDRSKMGRTDMGVDKKIAGDDMASGSDSQLVARQIARNIEANRGVIEPVLNNPAQVKGIVTQIMQAVMKQASHR